MFDTLIVFLKEFFEKVNLEKSQQTQRKHEKLPSMHAKSSETSATQYLKRYFVQE